MKFTFKKTRLDQVFGIQTDIPQHTYVNRSNLDERLKYLLGTQRHIVIHGASKQGKSSLRKKVFKDLKSIVVQCLPDKKVVDILNDIQRGINPTIVTETTKSTETTVGASGKTEAGVPMVGKVEASGSVETKGTTEEKYTSIPGLEKDLRFIKQSLENKNSRIILEDFHYLDEVTRKEMAFYLKSFFEEGIYVLIIGIWSEQNLLTYYNGDLSGRIEEIDLTWEQKDLKEVLLKGQKVLRIKFDPNVMDELVNSSFNNIGLLQRLAERVCFEHGVTESQGFFNTVTINTIDKLIPARHKVINDVRQRYIKIYDVFSRGFERSELEVYFNIFKAISTIPRQKLITGIPQSEMLSHVQKFNDKIRLSDLTAALNRVERLQSTRGITPLLIMYNENLREVHLVDREFLFYREYGNPDWEWLQPS